MCDVYVTPYLNEAQMTSGTLAYSFGLGKAVVSTPYWHAKELLADGRGILVPFGDAKALAAEIAGLLTNDVRRHSMRKRAYAASRSMTWAQTAERYLAIFEIGMRARHARNCASGRSDRLPQQGAGAARDRHRPFPVALRRDRHAAACRPFGGGPRARLLRRRQRPRPAVLERACGLRRDAIARDGHRALCGIRSARVEPGHPPLPQLHELRPPLARAGRLGGQSRPDALGLGRMRPPRHAIRRAADGPPRSSRRALPVVEEFPLAARLGLHAPGVGRLLRRRRRRPRRQPHARAAGRQVDGACSRRRQPRTGSGSRTCSPTTTRAFRRR